MSGSVKMYLSLSLILSGLYELLRKLFDISQSHSTSLVKYFAGKSWENINEDGEEQSENVNYKFLLKAVVVLCLKGLTSKNIC